ncbi:MULTISPECIES: methylated-DNA--[protein]-cysteine S-methyltransferase [Rhodococcus]|uniref:Cysteine methyltransferase n=1 Tax=Rhodococcoides kyotonense TaxID=398843 RepID=A0A177YBA1_9NOCA|nr:MULTISPECIES: methylated-DNA--[protein]-cysteine S-methyltransferase [Rhodococcus]NIL74270.1 Methylated-DNA--protein-cysteine methyltransferase [Rhodococcus sp. B10]OAK52479.1 cysteine methyltransferase [Rhodococcus kyotonensis]
MTALYAITDTPIGPFTTIVDDAGVVLASGWTATVDDLVPLVHRSLRPVDIRPAPTLGSVTKAVDEYHRGDLAAVDDVPVAQTSGEFLVHAWKILRTVPAGSPVTYSEFAAMSGRPTAIRGAASACARNAAALFVPCHRVLRIGGALGGFRWGLPAKEWLLAHERG